MRSSLRCRDFREPVLDPVARRATDYRGVDDVRIVGGSGELLGDDVVPGFVMRLDELW